MHVAMQVTVPFINSNVTEVEFVREFVATGERAEWTVGIGQLSTTVGLVPIFAPVGGTLRWSVQPGQRLSVGDVLAEIDPDPPITAPEPFDNGASPERAVLFIPYFGKFPSNFPLFLRSAGSNPWLTVKIFTDNPFIETCPANVRLIPSSLSQMKELCRERTGINPVIPRPYKLCDLRLLYAEMFAEHLEDNGWWGHGDLDVLYGNMLPFVQPGMTSGAGLIGKQGSFCLFRNNNQMRTLYKATAPAGGIDFGCALKDPVYRAMDEVTFLHPKMRELNLPCYRIAMVADTTYPPNKLSLGYRFSKEENSEAQVFVCRNGRLFKEFYDQGNFFRREFALLHLQKRPLSAIPSDVLDAEDFVVTPTGFKRIGPEPLSYNEMKTINPAHPLRDKIHGLGRYHRKVVRELQKYALRRKHREPR